MNALKVPELTVLDDGCCLFTRGDRYEIPLYQRPYAWGEEHIEQLIEDVDGIPVDGDRKYYLGSLVVARSGDGCYEVIDGQQRLTTLYLLLSALGVDVGERMLSFSCREKSDYTLAHLDAIASTGDVEERLVEPNIASGYKVVTDRIAVGLDGGIEAFKRKLSRTCIYRIEVPDRTDLNHYFEIMNTRGEQLEQHEVLKAWLMEPLSGDSSARFSRIWDACSDMSGYVQMSFGRADRERLFTWGYDHFPTEDRIRSLNWGSSDGGASLGIREIVTGGSSEDLRSAEGVDEPSRFESIIDFRYFLLHVLKVFVRTRGITSGNPDRPIVASLLDDKKLKVSFERVVEEGLWDGARIDRARFSDEFAVCLLQVRFLFDRCVIKREFDGGDLEGRWSLKELQRISSKGHRYRNTRFKQRNREWGTTSDWTNRQVLMLESCLRVSYTSPKVMHWITELLCSLMEEPGIAMSHSFVAVVERQAKDAVSDYVRAGEYALGVNTPHVVLNYLDYLLWARDRRRFDDFTFEFRTSVEHWYPQNPSDDTFVRWEEVNRLGNLCLVQRNVNSRFSNLNPLAKKATFQEMIAGGSLKLREMARLTTGVDDWKEGACQQHEEEMLGLLRDACGLS